MIEETPEPTDNGPTEPNNSTIASEPEVERDRSSSLHGLRVGSLLKTWAELSKINFFSMTPPGNIKLRQSLLRRSLAASRRDVNESLQCFMASKMDHSGEEDILEEQFPVNVTSLMNEDQLWGCFYIFPDLYADEYSPVVKFREIEDIPTLVEGVLTRDLVSVCLSYLKRTPILGDFVYIKLDLSMQGLLNIEVLQHYKYLVYLDLSSNFLKDLHVLSNLLYLQYLSVSFNYLETVLEYDTPQWFLTEVHYKYNSVMKIRDLTCFWSITILDFSHNNIKRISGLENLMHLRRLDLSFNHIQRLENLNNLPLIWLDVSYNNISSFEFGPRAGLFTLLHLEFLNINDNNLTHMKMFSGCSRLRHLHARNNGFSSLLDLAVYLRQLRRLLILDLRANPVTSYAGYEDVVVNTFPDLLCLDDVQLDPVYHRSKKMSLLPDVWTFATRRLQRLLFVEQLRRARVSPCVPPADTADVPLIVLVGQEAVGKRSLARQLAAELSSKVELALLHTTATDDPFSDHIQVSRQQFDTLICDGNFLTYSEINGESYGLSREQAFVHDGRVRVVCLDLIGALMLKLRGLRPYLILATCSDKSSLAHRQMERNKARENAYKLRAAAEANRHEKSTLQVLLSGRIIIAGILNELLVALPDFKEKSEFIIASECSLLMDSELRRARHENLRDIRATSSRSSEAAGERGESGRRPTIESLCSLYKDSQATSEYLSDIDARNQECTQSKKSIVEAPPLQQYGKMPSLTRNKSVDFTGYASSTWKGIQDSPKSSKSVGFAQNEATEVTETDPSGLLLDSIIQSKPSSKSKQIRSVSGRVPLNLTADGENGRDDDLWFSFLVDNGLLDTSHTSYDKSDLIRFRDTLIDQDPLSLVSQFNHYKKIGNETTAETINIRDEYETIHRNRPGMFWDTITMDNPDKAYIKMKNILKDIIERQKHLNPMLDIDFVNLPHYQTVQERLTEITKKIAPYQLFH